MEVYEIQCKDYLIKFELCRKNVKNLNLRLTADLRVVVSAHKRVPVMVIKAFVKSKAEWIRKNMLRTRVLQRENQQPKKYVSGEQLAYLGKQMVLEVAKGGRDSICRVNEVLFVTVKEDGNIKRKTALIERWYKDEADKVFEKLLYEIYPIVERYGVPRPDVKIRKMKSRWGSCRPRKMSITLNLCLIYTPKVCVEYVILHELVHFLHIYHDARFYEVMTKLMPDWKERRKLLNDAWLS